MTDNGGESLDDGDDVILLIDLASLGGCDLTDQLIFILVFLVSPLICQFIGLLIL
jgi:hypothetical protein